MLKSKTNHSNSFQSKQHSSKEQRKSFQRANWFLVLNFKWFPENVVENDAKGNQRDEICYRGKWRQEFQVSNLNTS